jgi:hypothetical protein
MSFRRWISLVAILGVLVHAGFLIVHHNMLLAASPGGFETGLLCRIPAPDTPDAPSTPVGFKCPICMGAAPAVAVLDLGVPIVDAPEDFALKLTYHSVRLTVFYNAKRPHSRAPPVFA